MASKNGNGNDVSGLTFEPLEGASGHPYNVQYVMDPKTQTLWIKVPMTAAAIKAAPTSQSGKSKLLGNSGGFVPIPGGYKANVCITTRV